MSSLTMQAVVTALREAELLPVGDSSTGGWSELVGQTGNLLPVLLQMWESALAHRADGAERRRAIHMVRWLRKHQRAGASLTCGLPAADMTMAEAWIGLRLAWWPSGIPPAGHCAGIISSRMGRSLESHPAWFAVLRAACARCTSQGDLLLSAGETTTGKYVRRCAELFGASLLRIETVDDRRCTLASWARRIRRTQPPSRDNPLCRSVLLSPMIGQRCPDSGSRPYQLEDTPLRDRAVVAMSRQLIVLYVRRRGTVDRLLRARLGDPRWPAASVHVTLEQSLTEAGLAEELMGLGAVGWRLPAGSKEIACHSTKAPSTLRLRSSTAGISQTARGEIMQLTVGQRWNYLTHCTRRRDGPWPDQDETDYLDDLILEREGRDHSALAAVLRIVKQRRLIATGRTIRGGTPVISFTAVPLPELHRLRVFRPHRSRWDFQPYGICIHRDWLERRGARAVCYADDRRWVELTVGERPFFQLQHTRSQRGAAMDWTVEQEWRHVGDLALNELEPGSAFLFVPSRAEAEELSCISPWPVVVVGYP